MVDIVQNEVVGHQSQYLERDFLKKHDTGSTTSLLTCNV